MLGHDWRFVKTPLKCNHWMEKHRQALPPSLLSDHRHDLSARSNRGKWRMTEMQWSCKTTKFHITLCLILLCSSAGKTGCSEGMRGPECVSVCGYFHFCFPPSPWYLQSECVIRAWVPLVTIVLANIGGQSSWFKHRTSSSAHRTKLSREGTWFNLFWSSLYLSNLLLSPHQFCVRGLLFLHGH